MVLHSIPLYDRNLSYCPILKLTVSSAFLSSFSKSAPFVIFVVATEIASLASWKYGPVESVKGIGITTLEETGGKRIHYTYLIYRKTRKRNLSQQLPVRDV